MLGEGLGVFHSDPVGEEQDRSRYGVPKHHLLGQNESGAGVLPLHRHDVGPEIGDVGLEDRRIIGEGQHRVGRSRVHD